MADNHNGGNYAANLLAKRGRRTSATLLTYIEKNFKNRLNSDEWEQLRQKILDTVGDFQDLATDMVAADTAAINEFWIDALVEIRKAIKEAVRAERQDTRI